MGQLPKTPLDSTELANRIRENECRYPDGPACEHYLELFNCCMRPSVPCDYRKRNNDTKNEN